MDITVQAVIAIGSACISLASGLAGVGWVLSRWTNRVESLEKKWGKIELNTEDAEAQSAQARLTAELVLQAHQYIKEDQKAMQERIEKTLNAIKEEFARQIDDSHDRFRELLDALLRPRPPPQN